MCCVCLGRKVGLAQNPFYHTTNVAEGTTNSDAITKHQVDTLKNQLRADSLQVDGSSHMTGDLDLRGQKLINPGEIKMNRKLITNLGH